MQERQARRPEALVNMPAHDAHRNITFVSAAMVVLAVAGVIGLLVLALHLA